MLTSFCRPTDTMAMASTVAVMMIGTTRLPDRSPTMFFGKKLSMTWSSGAVCEVRKPAVDSSSTSLTPEPMCSGMATPSVITMAIRLVSSSQPTDRNPMLRSFFRLPT